VLVYGDHAWIEDSRGILSCIEAELRTAEQLELGIDRHAKFVNAWLKAGELMQGIADAELDAHGFDEASPAQHMTMRLLMVLARNIINSWRGQRGIGTDAAFALLPAAARVIGSRSLRIKAAEGHAFYALYPEGYLEAARPLAPAPEFGVVGLRTIGAGLASVVAAALGAPDPMTVRPKGDPKARILALGSKLKEAISRHAGWHWAIVDEGPGCTGSSIASTAEALREQGVCDDRIHVFCSHMGLPRLEAPTRNWWMAATRHVTEFDDWALSRRKDGWALSDWAADLIGQPVAPLEDIGAGAWRSHLFGAREWPPVWPEQERRKYLVRTHTGTWLLKFVGLGDIGERKLARARALAADGFSPDVIGFRHGFLVERWLGSARPLSCTRFPRDRLIERVARYLGFRAAHFTAGERGVGASLSELSIMARHDIRLALGTAVSTSVDPLLRTHRELESSALRVEIDGKLQPWEWLVTDDSRLWKTDAVDHHAAHDLVGCQDVAWDIAGASVELGLTPMEQRTMCAIVSKCSGRPVDPNLLRFMTVCYAAFQIGRCTLAGEMTWSKDVEGGRLARARQRYEQHVLSLVNERGYRDLEFAGASL
jgi:hypothetical protein